MQSEPQTDGMQQFLLPIFDLFTQPDVAIQLALAMLVILAIILLWFWCRHAIPALIALQGIVKRVRRVVDPSAFANEFAAVDETISKKRLLKHAWEEFKETLITDDAGPVRNTARPSAYLNVSGVAGELHLSFYQAVPNYFVGFGLLFTFLGLVAAIHFASQGVAGDNVAQAKVALQHLLSAATFKFATSIAGLISSLILSIALRLFVSHVQLHFERLCQLLEQRMIFVTPEALAIEQLGELKKQSLQLERFNTDFAVEVAKALEERLNASLGSVIGQAVSPMVSAIDGMAKNFGAVNQDAMQKIVGEFKTSMQGAAGTEMNALAGAISTMHQSLSETMSSIRGSSSNFGERVEASAARLERMLDNASVTLKSDAEKVSSQVSEAVASTARELQASIANIAELWSNQLSSSASGFGGAIDRAGANLAAQVDGTTSRLSTVIMPFAEQVQGLEGTLRTLDGRLKAQTEGIDGSIGRLSQFLTQMDRSLDLLRNAGAPIAQTADRFSAAAHQIELTSSVIREGQEKLSEMVKTIHEGARLLNNSWEDYRNRFEKVDTDLSAAFVRLQEGTDAYHKRIIEYVKQVDSHFTNSLSLLGGGIDQLKDTVEDLVEAIGKPNGGPKVQGVSR